MLQGEYVPTMPCWDPAVASACGQPVTPPTEAVEAMLDQTSEAQENVPSSPEAVAPADPHLEVSTVSLLPWRFATDLVSIAC